MSSWARLTGGEDGPERGSFADAFKETERRLSALERHRRGAISSDGTDTFLRSGDFVVTGGNIRVLDNGDVIIDGGELRAVSGATTRTLLDRDRLRLNRADGTRQVEITPAGGLRVYAANGTTLLTTLDGDKVQVGNDVVLDAAGLKIQGVLQEAGLVGEAIQRRSSQAQNVALTTTQQNVVSATVTPPSWATTAIVFGFLKSQITESSSAKNVTTQFRIGTSNFDSLQQGLSTSPATESFTNVTSFTESSTGSPINLPDAFTMHGRVHLNTGTNNTNFFVLMIIALFGR